MRPVLGAGTGLSPLDDELGLLPGALTPRLQAGLVRLASWMPFAHAARELGWLTRAVVSRHVARRLTEAAGAAYVATQTAAVEALERRPTPEPVGPAVLQLSADGAMISLVGQQWVEVKTLAIGTVVQTPTGEGRARELSYFSRRAEHRAFRRLALVEAHRRGARTAGTVVAVMDGADWLQRFIDFHRHDAVRVLDFPHAVEYLTRASQEALGVGMAATADSKAWLARQARALKHDGPTPVLAAVRTLPPGTHRDAALASLEPRLPQLQYPTYRAAGYPIGSGIVERANKVVVEDRLKGSGMHWDPQHVDPLLALRTAVCADRWDEAWLQISARLRAADRTRRLQRHQAAVARRVAREAARRAATAPPDAPTPTLQAPAAPAPSPPPQPTPKTIVNGRPTKAHPWNRRYLPHRPASPAEN
ncbi:MAG TPA: hypothetical protein VFN74_15420 [Chloroflexota bacterium]|nr:hypothetical protein [Chloroflexota bacterium]